MKKLLLLISLFAASVLPSMAEGADWYLYLYSNGVLANQQFETTDEENVFTISSFVLTQSGVSFCVRNGAWSTMYGWGSGSVETSGTPVTLASASQATGWISLAAGTYDVTFNSSDLTIQFDASASGPTFADYYLYIWSDTSGEAGSAIADAQFMNTEDPNIVVLNNFNLAETGVKFCVRNSAWSMLAWAADGDANVSSCGSASHLGSATGANGWIDLAAGTYNVTFNISASTIQFDYLYTEQRTSAADRWGTVCLPFEVSSIENAVAYNVEGLNSNSTGLVLSEAALPLEAGKPYFYKASAANVMFNSTSSTTASAAVAAAGLVGNITGASMNVANNGTSYVLSNNELHPVNSANVKISDRRAYVDIDGLSDVSTTSAPGRVIMQLPAVATDIESVGQAQIEKMFINGQVVIVRDGVRYNVMGQIIR